VQLGKLCQVCVQQQQPQGQPLWLLAGCYVGCSRQPVHLMVSCCFKADATQGRITCGLHLQFYATAVLYSGKAAAGADAAEESSIKAQSWNVTTRRPGGHLSDSTAANTAAAVATVYPGKLHSTSQHTAGTVSGDSYSPRPTVVCCSWSPTFKTT